MGHFTTWPASCNNRRMKPVLLLQRVLCTLAMVAVLIGPAAVATAAAAMASSASMQSPDATMGMGTDMDTREQSSGSPAMADMDCCPKAETPQMPDCMKTCPLALVCSTAIVASGPFSGGDPVAYALPLSYLIHQETDLASALVEPPPRPPSA
ncbi:hypothetical protein [Sinorhizobium medicae]|uniref:hypothetical protein n=2 Tax=Hyphomicrobiales TaxID=356 RepID=UPI0011A2D3CC|nr:hypothetical protein [Sinorhizobium medicae]